MKKLRKISSVILGVIISCMCLVTPVSAAENSEMAIGESISNAIVTADMPSHCKHCTMEILEHNHNTLELLELSHINSTSACNHSGEKTNKFVGYCPCGGVLYSVNCKACGTFVRGMCLNFCGRWD